MIPEIGRRAAAKIPHAQFEVIRARHAPYLDDPGGAVVDRMPPRAVAAGEDGLALALAGAAANSVR